MYITYINLRGNRKKNQKKEKSMETGNIWCKRPRKKPKYTTQFVLDTTMRIQTQIT